ncbi:MAG: hypothetical protein ABS61_11140 [Microbacterium sp. SCN 70-18]|nr:MAG: hypothetical protein ABS61_11140 [Microbacterium sp. SCN 70-18]
MRRRPVRVRSPRDEFHRDESGLPHQSGTYGARVARDELSSQHRPRRIVTGALLRDARGAGRAAGSDHRADLDPLALKGERDVRNIAREQGARDRRVQEVVRDDDHDIVRRADHVPSELGSGPVDATSAGGHSVGDRPGRGGGDGVRAGDDDPSPRCRGRGGGQRRSETCQQERAITG